MSTGTRLRPFAIALVATAALALPRLVSAEPLRLGVAATHSFDKGGDRYFKSQLEDLNDARQIALSSIRGDNDRLGDDDGDDIRFAIFGQAIRLAAWSHPDVSELWHFGTKHELRGLGWHKGWLHKGLTVTRTDNSPAPEPASMILLGTGLAGVVGSRFRKKSIKS
jgi:hypothetical protein